MVISRGRAARRLGLVGLLAAASSLGLTTSHYSASAHAPPPQPPADPAIVFIGNGKLTVMNADGSNAREIYSGSATTPNWSPDGRAIVFVGNNGLWTIDVSVVNGVPQGSNATLWLAAAPGETLQFPSWSPLGDEIAFIELYSDTLRVAPIGGGPAEVLFDAPDADRIFWPSWNPDGTRLAFTHWEPQGSPLGQDHIKLVDRASGQVTNALTLDPPWAIYESEWARTQDKIVFQLWTYAGEVPRAIYTLDLSTGLTTRIVETTSTLSPARPSWSPDDSRIVIHNHHNERLATVNMATGAVTTFRNRNADWPNWRRY